MASPVTGVVHLSDVIQRPAWLQSWERLRNGSLSLLIEGCAEALGVFFYVYCGAGATLVFNLGTLAKLPGVGSLLTVGFAYALGIGFAVSFAAVSGGGHFNPCVSIAHAVWRNFPWRKVPVYIFFQILGAFIACLLVYGQYRSTIMALEEALLVSPLYQAIRFTPNGIPGAFGIYQPSNTALRDVFMNEFFVDFFLALIIWGVLDPTNAFVPPSMAPWVVGVAYAAAIWAYAPAGLAANSARDVGGRLMALSIWGKPAAGGKYAAIAALTNIPATLLATLVYELLLVDSTKVVPRAQQELFNGMKAQAERKALGPQADGVNSSDGSNEKAGMKENA